MATNITQEERERIWEEVEEIQQKSASYQQYGHEISRDETASLSPSKEFRDKLFKKVAKQLGIE